MSDIPDFLDGEIVAVLTQQIEDRFAMPLVDLARAVKAAPRAHVGATNVVHAHGLLTQAQYALGKAEDRLVAALGTVVGDILDDPVMGLAQQVNGAVEQRDAHAARLRSLLEAMDEQPVTRARPVSRLATTLPTAVPARPVRIARSVR
ncbi:hypothetical protein AB0C52_24880 [Streptomyces sp. NPDC048717]|uniref:hypothetical protein n=1 Tax=Streptomyces sp. NPDC048717 TaxID=3154928 RepID=UPI00341C93A6